MNRNGRLLGPALSVLVASATSVALGTGSAQATDDGSCVGKGEYQAIVSGMTIQKLAEVLHGQTPFAETDGTGKQHYRWYAACDTWQPDLDVSVRYHQPVVGRRTVTKKHLAVYQG